MEFSIISPVIIFGLLGFTIVWVLVPLIQKVATRRDAEARHHDHSGEVPVSRFGGVALAAVLLAVLFSAKSFLGKGTIQHGELVMVLGALAMFAVGLLDDIRPIGAKWKLACQIIIASAVYSAGIEIQNLTNPITHTSFSLAGFGYFATVFWLVAMTNLINLIDGIDGLAGGIALMLMCLLAYTGLVSLNFYFLVAVAVAGGLVAFIYYNFPPAKIYLGDGGAYFLGFLIGLLTIQSSQKGTIAAALIAPIFALGVPIMDVLLAIVRRGVKGLPIFRPDRRHIHHKMMASGFSRKRTLLTLYALSLVCLFLAFAVFWHQGKLLPILFGCLFLLLLISARSLGLVRDWFTADGTLGNVLRMRRETRYALCLASWLELEADRCAEPKELWEGYVFFASKVGFSRVRLVLVTGELVWSRAGNIGAIQTVSLPVATGNVRALEFTSETATMSPKLFEHLTELAGEAWLKAALRWEQSHGHAIQM